VLAQLLGPGKHRTALALALPVEVLQEKGEGERVEREMRRWLEGAHVFSVDGEPITVTISAIKARVSQPAATWFDWGLDLFGQWARGSAAAKAPALIIDEGFNTLDVLVVQGGRIHLRHTAGETLGMRRAAERLADSLNRKHSLDVDVFGADGLLKDSIGGGRPVVYKGGKELDITNECRQAVRSLEADVMTFIERNVGKGGAYTVLLTGGGALAFADRLQRQFAQATVMPEPVLANARGLAKLAVRDGFLG
jgi:hypothetical protein